MSPKRSAAGNVREVSPGVWQITVSAGYDPRTGKRRRKYSTIRGSRRDAERERARMVVLYSGAQAPSEDITFGEFFANWYMPDCRSRLRPTTCDAYEKDFAVLAEGALGPLALSRITPAVLDRWLASLPASRRAKAYALARQVFRRAMRWDMVPSDPTRKIDPPPPSDYEPDVLDAAGARAYLEAFRGSDVEAAVLVAIGAGLRRSEIVALDWSDVRDGAVTVDDAITCAVGGLHRDKPKSRFGFRTVALPASIAARLEELRGDGPLLVSNGRRMSPNTLSSKYSAALRDLPDGVMRVPLKNLRHTSLTLALQGGADLLAVSRRGGHSTPSITSRYYLRPDKSVDEGAAAGLDSLLEDDGETP